MSKTIAFFDFDNTLTIGDSFIDYLKFSFGQRAVLWATVKLSPVLVLFKLGVLSNTLSKRKVLTHFLKGLSIPEFRELGKAYAANKLESLLNPRAYEKLRWHKEQGHEVCVVSASLYGYIRYWCAKEEIHLIATKVGNNNGILHGGYKTTNCYGPIKEQMIKEQFNLDEYDAIYAYGDSRGDREMLALATHPFYRAF